MFFISFILFYSTRRFFKHKISAFTILNQSDRISKTTQISNSEHRLLNRKQCPLPIRVNIYCAPGTSAEKYGDEFYKQIRQFERRGQIIIWNQARIPAGSNQDEEINQATVS